MRRHHRQRPRWGVQGQRVEAALLVRVVVWRGVRQREAEQSAHETPHEEGSRRRPSGMWLPPVGRASPVPHGAALSCAVCRAVRRPARRSLAARLSPARARRSKLSPSSFASHPIFRAYRSSYSSHVSCYNVISDTGRNDDTTSARADSDTTALPFTLYMYGFYPCFYQPVVSLRRGVGCPSGGKFTHT